jgi:DNA-binding HxlR family transcriptional regulator
MRSYGQYCSVARALDVVGDRWTLLIVRELLLQGPSRYTDLRNGLPGIATNLLADRLRELERVGIVRSQAAPPPIASTLFSLTERGQELEPVLRELGRWGAPAMSDGPGPQDEFRGHWLSFPVDMFLADQAPDQPPVTLELRAGGETMTVEASDGSVRTRRGGVTDPDLALRGPPQLILGAIAGKIALEQARDRGLEVDGDPRVLSRLRPEPS